jgi:hypothetical protein
LHDLFEKKTRAIIRVQIVREVFPSL